MEQNILRMMANHSQPVLAWKNNECIFQNEAAELLFSEPGGEKARGEIRQRLALCQDNPLPDMSLQIGGCEYGVILSRIGEMILCQIQTVAVSGVSPFFAELLGGQIRNSAAMISMASRLLSDNAPEQNKRYFAILNHNYYKLSKLGNALQRISQCEDDSLTLERSGFDLAKCCEELAQSAEYYLTKQAVSVSFHGEGEILVYADKIRLQQAILCLLSNAVKVSELGTAIEIVVSSDGTKATIKITDRGSGFAKKNASPVMEKYGVPSFASDPKEGLGAGLLYARTVAQKHGGTLILESREGKGTTAVLSIELGQNNNCRVKTEKVNYEFSEGELLLTELADVLDTSCYYE